MAVLGLLVLGALGYYFFLRSPDTTVISTDLIVPQEGEVVGQDILVLVDKLKTISIDSSLFSGALFSNLKDEGVILTPESQGRSNPFAIIGQ